MSATEWAVGMRVTSARLNSGMVRMFRAQASSDLPASSTNTAIPDLEIPITTLADNVDWHIGVTVDIDATGSSTNIVTAELMLNGVAQSGQALGQSPTGSSTFRGTYAQFYGGTLATAGSYTFLMRGTTPASMEINAIHSKMNLITVGHVSP